MTFEQLLVKYLYQHKKVSLQGFGTVTLNSNVPDIELIHKNRQIPIEGVIFDPNIKATTDENFVLFFSQQRGKIRPLAESDIESHLQLAKQLMNIGKPYEVEGLGIFAMQKDGSVVLQPGQYAVTFADNAGPARLKERTEQQEKTEAEASGSAIGSGARKVLIAAAILLGVLVIGWFIWSKMVNKPSENTASGVPASDTAQSVKLLQDSLATPPVSTEPLPVWRAYFRSFTGKEHLPNMVRLYQKYDSVKIETADSTTFRMYVVFQSLVADTAFKADSLNKLFLRPISLEKQSP